MRIDPILLEKRQFHSIDKGHIGTPKKLGNDDGQTDREDVNILGGCFFDELGCGVVSEILRGCKYDEVYTNRGKLSVFFVLSKNVLVEA